MPDSPAIAQLDAALQSNDTGAFLLALGGAVRAHGEAAIAQACGWSVADLEAVLKPDSAPQL